MPKSKNELSELPPWQKNMLILMDWYKTSKLGNYKSFCEEIGFEYSNLAKLKNGESGFKIEQLIRAAELTGVSLDSICEVKTNIITIAKISALLQ